MSLIPGLGILKGMGLTFVRMFEPKATIKYPEVPADVVNPLFDAKVGEWVKVKVFLPGGEGEATVRVTAVTDEEVEFIDGRQPMRRRKLEYSPSVENGE